MPSWFSLLFGAGGFRIWNGPRPSLVQLLYSFGPQKGCHRQLDICLKCRTLGTLAVPWEELPFTCSHFWMGFTSQFLGLSRWLVLFIVVWLPEPCPFLTSFRSFIKSYLIGKPVLATLWKTPHSPPIQHGTFPSRLFSSSALIITNIYHIFYVFHHVVCLCRI